MSDSKQPTKVLVVGGGGREHALCRALMTASPAPDLWVTPGNPGIGGLGKTLDVPAGDVDALARAAKDGGFDLVIPGPEQPLVDGLADRLAALGVPCCGPSAEAAQLEGSKAFTRQLCAEVGLPSPRFAVLTDADALASAVASWDGIPVIKADGLAAGKGVLLPDAKDACVAAGRELLDGALGGAGRTLVIEDRLEGVEASLFYACHGVQAVALPHARDHKRVGDGDQGPNTGGMGAISPNPIIDDALEQSVREQIVIPTLQALQSRGTPFCGFLYAGLMLTPDGCKLLEYNVRLGDPEAQAILPRLKAGELLRLCLATARGELEGFDLGVDPRSTCAIVVAARGYPGTPNKGDVIHVDRDLATRDRWLDQAGTKLDGDALVTAGGRVAAVVARGSDAVQARRLAYEGVERVRFAGMHFRTDIGAERAPQE